MFLNKFDLFSTVGPSNHLSKFTQAQHTGTAKDQSMRSTQRLCPDTKNVTNSSTSVLERWRNEIFTSEVDLKTEKFTIVMLTYRREAILPKILKHYCNTPRLEKILVIWNDIEKEIPSSILDLSKDCKTQLQFIKEAENKITNRFKPRPEVTTECVCVYDVCVRACACVVFLLSESLEALLQ